MRQPRLWRILKKHKASVSKMGRDREDESRKTGERFPGQNTKMITDRFVLGVACAVLTLFCLHLLFKDS